VNRLPFDVTVVVTDALVAAGEDTQLVFTRRAAARLADALLAHLEVLGYRIEPAP
jgi:hypothetical protein